MGYTQPGATGFVLDGDRGPQTHPTDNKPPQENRMGLAISGHRDRRAWLCTWRRQPLRPRLGLFQADNGAPGLILEGHIHAVVAIEYYPCGRQNAPGSADTTIRIRDIKNGEPGMEALEHGDKVEILKCSPNGQAIAVVWEPFASVGYEFRSNLGDRGCIHERN